MVPEKHSVQFLLPRSLLLGWLLLQAQLEGHLLREALPDLCSHRALVILSLIAQICGL